MTTDRELLEWAAKAAEIEFGVIHQRPHRRCPEGWTPWNPLTDDGDALRLAVKLGIGVLFDLQDEIVTAYEQAPYEGYHVEFADEQAPAAATRRAIVRAAASIGQQKEGG